MPSVLILGASSDIAIATARMFAKDNYDIILAGRDIQSLNAFRGDLEIRYKVKAEAVAFDALDFISHRFFFENLAVKPSVTICIFGYLGNQSKAEMDWAEAERIINTNYTGAASVLNIIAQYYQQQKSGAIAGVSSVAGERGRQSNYFYGSAKAGFTAYLAGLRNRMYKYNVHVATINPGFVDTKMTADLKLPPLLTASPEQVAAAIKKAIIKKRNTTYVKWFWRWIMLLIKMIPEPLFKKMKM